MSKLRHSPVILGVSLLCMGCMQGGKTPGKFSISSEPRPGRQAAQEANERGLALAEKQAWDEAEKAFREALRYDEGYAAAHNNLGLIRLHKGRYFEAATSFRTALSLEPNAPQPRANLNYVLGKHQPRRETIAISP